MAKRSTHAFRPVLEAAEDRLLTAGIVATIPHGQHALGVKVHHTARPVNYNAQDKLQGAKHQQPLVLPAVSGAKSGRVVIFGTGVGSSPGGQGTLPARFRNWGVITIWNTTRQTTTFSVAASTFQAGRFFNFTLRPGQYQSYYAAFDNFNLPPTFRVSFDPIQKTNPVQLSNVNTVFESARWIPRVGTEGFPYAIAVDASGRYLAPI